MIIGAHAHACGKRVNVEYLIELMNKFGVVMGTVV